MEFTFSLSGWIILQLFILPVLLPLAVGLVTKYTTSSSLKALLLLALSVITALLTEMLSAFQNGVESFDLGLALLQAIVTFVIGVGFHFGLLKPTGLTDKAQAIGNSTGSLSNDKTIEG